MKYSRQTHAVYHTRYHFNRQCARANLYQLQPNLRLDCGQYLAGLVCKGLYISVGLRRRAEPDAIAYSVIGRGFCEPSRLAGQSVRPIPPNYRCSIHHCGPGGAIWVGQKSPNICFGPRLVQPNF